MGGNNEAEKKTLTFRLHLHREQVQNVSCKASQPGQKDLQATSREETTAADQSVSSYPGLGSRYTHTQRLNHFSNDANDKLYVV